MKKFRKNNKGFSLVELIVVVLIIAIIAVALAPQVIKWVSTAGDNTDTNNEGTIKATVATAVAEYMSKGNAAPTITYKASPSKPAALTVVGEDNATGLKALIEAALGEVPGLKGSSDGAKNTYFEIKIESAVVTVKATHD